MNQQKIERLKSTNNFNRHPEKVRHDLFQESSFFDPHDKVQVKYEMLRTHFLDDMSITAISDLFGFSRETFYTILHKFEEHGAQALINEKRGRKTRYKITPEISGYIITLKAKDPALSSATIVRKVRKRFDETISKKSVRRELKKFGLLKKRGYIFK